MSLSSNGVIIQTSVSVFFRGHITTIGILAILFVLGLFAPSSFAGHCLDDWACWEARRGENSIEFWVVNKKPYQFTASIDVKTSNLRGQKATDRHQATQVVLGNSERLLLRLQRVDADRPMRYRDVFYWTPGDMSATHADETKYLPPYAAGESFPLVQGFGGGWSHRGASRYAVDFAMPVGTPVHAARSGVVVQTVDHHDRGGASRRYAKYANYIVVLHSDGTTGEYHHLKRKGVVVSVGQEVKAGQHLGYSGNTGFSSLPHLHFAVYRPMPMGDFESIPFQFTGGVNTRSWWQRLVK